MSEILNGAGKMKRLSNYYLRGQTVQRLIEQQHLTQTRVAEQLGLSRSYWSQLLNRHRPLTPAVRSRLLRSRYFKGMGELELWEIVSKPEVEHE